MVLVISPRVAVMPKYEDSRADPKDEEQKQARLSKSTPIGEDGKPYVEWDFNVRFIHRK
jgi:hypothetical protein